MAEPDNRIDVPAPGSSDLPNDIGLPPVEPPSARFIVQLFVVPALIVAAVIGVYVLFGKLASSDVDWREHAADLRSSNPQVRWRAALGLAQLLEADGLRSRRDVPLAQDPELAAELAQTLTLELAKPSTGEEHDRLVDYLIKAIGWMDVAETVLPPLQSAMQPERSNGLVQQALNSTAMVTGRAFENEQPVTNESLTRDLIRLTNSQTDVLRHLAAYNLGLVSSTEGFERLRQLTSHSDKFMRLQAAIGLARQKSLDGLPVFEDILTEGRQYTFDPTTVRTEQDAAVYFETAKPVVQAITAGADLREQLSPEQHAEWVRLIEPYTKVADADLRHHAIEKLSLLKSAANAR